MAYQAHLIFWRRYVVITIRESIPPGGTQARKVKDYEAVPMQIGFLYYPECHHFPRRAYPFLILQGCFFLCVIYHFV